MQWKHSHVFHTATRVFSEMVYATIVENKMAHITAYITIEESRNRLRDQNNQPRLAEIAVVVFHTKAECVRVQLKEQNVTNATNSIISPNFVCQVNRKHMASNT